jgi:hypothetical protein
MAKKLKASNEEVIYQKNGVTIKEGRRIIVMRPSTDVPCTVRVIDGEFWAISETGALRYPLHEVDYKLA